MDVFSARSRAYGDHCALQRHPPPFCFLLKIKNELPLRASRRIIIKYYYQNGCLVASKLTSAHTYTTLANASVCNLRKINRERQPHRTEREKQLYTVYGSGIDFDVSTNRINQSDRGAGGLVEIVIYLFIFKWRGVVVDNRFLFIDEAARRKNQVWKNTEKNEGGKKTHHVPLPVRALTESTRISGKVSFIPNLASM